MINLKPRRRVPHICMRCNSDAVSVVHRSDLLDFKGLTVEVSGLAETVCGKCGYRWTTDGQEQDNLQILQHAYTVKRDALRVRDGLLTGDEIAFVLDALALSRADAARLFGGGPNAFAKYIRGEVLQSFPMDRLLRLTLAFGKPALAVLQLGAQAPLQLHSGGFFVSPAVSAADFQKMETEPALDGQLQHREVNTSSCSTTLTLEAA